MANCKVIAIANQKGGTGKTTITVILGIGLTREGKKVFLVDADLDAGVGEISKADLDALVVAGATVEYNGTSITVMNDGDNDGIDDNNATVVSAEVAYELAAAGFLAAKRISDTLGSAEVTNNDDGTVDITLGQAEVANVLSFNLHVGADADLTNKI